MEGGRGGEEVCLMREKVYLFPLVTDVQPRCFRYCDLLFYG